MYIKGHETKIILIRKGPTVGDFETDKLAISLKIVVSYSDKVILTDTY